VGLALSIYSNENRGWLYPVGPDGEDGRPTTFGTRHPPHLRWPVYVRGLGFKPPASLPYDPATFNSKGFDPVAFPAEPFTPPVLRCPTDQEPAEAHSYVLNKHLADKRIRNSTTHFAGLSSSEVIVAGEKITSQRDYYMEDSDFDNLVERYRHGAKLGSNYLYHDGHVGNVLPPKPRTGLDPWEPRLPNK
jgi:prepilin-type processing-associated H-X9-DG protein